MRRCASVRITIADMYVLGDADVAAGQNNTVQIVQHLETLHGLWIL